MRPLGRPVCRSCRLCAVSGGTSVDLDEAMAVAAQVAGQYDSVAAGALDTPRADPADRGGPCLEPGLALPVGRCVMLGEAVDAS